MTDKMCCGIFSCSGAVDEISRQVFFFFCCSGAIGEISRERFLCLEVFYTRYLAGFFCCPKSSANESDSGSRHFLHHDESSISNDCAGTADEILHRNNVTQKYANLKLLQTKTEEKYRVIY